MSIFSRLKQSGSPIISRLRSSTAQPAFNDPELERDLLFMKSSGSDLVEAQELINKSPEISNKEGALKLAQNIFRGNSGMGLIKNITTGVKAMFNNQNTAMDIVNKNLGIPSIIGDRSYNIYVRKVAEYMKNNDYDNLENYLRAEKSRIDAGKKSK